MKKEGRGGGICSEGPGKVKGGDIQRPVLTGPEPMELHIILLKQRGVEQEIVATTPIKTDSFIETRIFGHYASNGRRETIIVWHYAV